MAFSVDTLKDLSNIKSVDWKNNVTRLNQTNLNIMSDGIIVLKDSLSSFGTAVKNKFDALDTKISDLDTSIGNPDSGLTKQVNDNKALLENLKRVFRYKHDGTESFPYAGIIHTDSAQPLVIKSTGSLQLIAGEDVLTLEAGEASFTGDVYVEGDVQASTSTFGQVFAAEYLDSNLNSITDFSLLFTQDKFDTAISEQVLSKINETLDDVKSSLGI